MSREKFPIFHQNVYTSAALVNGAPVTLRDAFPLGEVYYTMNLNFKIVLTNTTGTSAISLGELKLIKDITLKADYDDVIVKACGKALYYRAAKQLKTLPYKDAITTTAGTFYVSIPIHFANRRLRRPEDTALNTARYRSMELTVTLGTIADLLGSVGDGAITVTLDVDIEKSMFAADRGNAPKVVPYIYGMPPINPANQTYLDIEKNPDLAIFDVMMQVGNSATAGEAWACTPADTTIATVNFEDNVTFPYRSQPWQAMKNYTKEEIEAETALTGIILFNFVRDHSLLSSYDTGDKAKCQVNWTNGTLSTSQVNLLLDGWKKMKAGR